MEEKSYKICKKLMIIFNIIFLLGGMAILGIGIWMVVDASTFIPILRVTTTLIVYSAYIVIGVGALTIIISLFGFIGAWKESSFLLTTFSISLIIIILIEIVAMALAFAYAIDLRLLIVDSAVDSIKNDYGVQAPITSAWDFIQTTFECCGFNNGLDYENSVYDMNQGSNYSNPWPPSCCVLNGTDEYVDINQCRNNPDIDPAITAESGCFDSLQSILSMYSAVIGGVLAAVIFLQCLAVIFSCCVSSAIRQNLYEFW